MQAAEFGLHEAPGGLAACAAELRAQPRVRPWRRPAARAAQRSVQGARRTHRLAPRARPIEPRRPTLAVASAISRPSALGRENAERHGTRTQIKAALRQ